MRPFILYAALSLTVVLVGCGGTANTGGTTGADLDATFLDEIVVYQMEMVSDAGQPWDADGSGPDLRLAILPTDVDVEEFLSPVYHNVKTADLPKEWDISSRRIPMSGQSWRIILYDQDDNNMQEIYQWTISPTLEENAVVLEGNSERAFRIVMEMGR